VVNEAIFQVMSDFQRRFPPARYENIKSIPDSDDNVFFRLPRPHVSKYVFDAFRKLDDVRGAGH
jgi:hypothetical protein